MMGVFYAIILYGGTIALINDINSATKIKDWLNVIGLLFSFLPLVLGSIVFYIGALIYIILGDSLFNKIFSKDKIGHFAGLSLIITAPMFLIGMLAIIISYNL